MSSMRTPLVSVREAIFRSLNAVGSVRNSTSAAAPSGTTYPKWRKPVGTDSTRPRQRDEGSGATAVNHVALEVAGKLVYLFDEAPYEAAGIDVTVASSVVSGSTHSSPQ